jgi:hypothetical protein
LLNACGINVKCRMWEKKLTDLGSWSSGLKRKSRGGRQRKLGY